jgi:hypothetical protein
MSLYLFEDTQKKFDRQLVRSVELAWRESHRNPISIPIIYGVLREYSDRIDNMVPTLEDVLVRCSIIEDILRFENCAFDAYHGSYAASSAITLTDAARHYLGLENSTQTYPNVIIYPKRAFEGNYDENTLLLERPSITHQLIGHEVGHHVNGKLPVHKYKYVFTRDNNLEFLTELIGCACCKWVYGDVVVAMRPDEDYRAAQLIVKNHSHGGLISVVKEYMSRSFPFDDLPSFWKSIKKSA